VSGRIEARRLDPSEFTEADRRRFWTKVEVGSAAECWLWTAYRTPKGYGRFGWHGYAQYAHRWSYALHSGAEVPVDLVIDHLCRNPGCVNPTHLEAVAHGENISRGIPAKSKTTHCPQGHPYSPENTYRWKGSDGRLRRTCRECKLARLRKRSEQETYKQQQREYRKRTRPQRLAYERTLLEARRIKGREVTAALTPEEREARNARARERYHARKRASGVG
jgi:hypothetical protein